MDKFKEITSVFSNEWSIINTETLRKYGALVEAHSTANIKLTSDIDIVMSLMLLADIGIIELNLIHY